MCTGLWIFFRLWPLLLSVYLSPCPSTRGKITSPLPVTKIRFGFIEMCHTRNQTFANHIDKIDTHKIRYILE
jgi:hypothetical protein